jgi:aminoacylase
MSFIGNCESAESALRASLPASDWEAIEAFRQFLRIRTVSAEGPVTGAYRAAVDYLHSRFSAAGVQCEIKEYVAGKPILLATVPGTEPNLPSVLLNSHYDVVPVMPEKWTYEPFSGVVNEHQEIVGRGAQDMKVVCIQYVESLLALLRAGRRFRRTIHLSFVPDEEVSGRDGMCKWLSDGDAFQSLNVGLALDEGIASETDKFTVFYGERAIWWLKVRATGVTGHASRLPTHTAMQSLIESIQHFLDFRQTQVDKLHGGCAHAQAIKLGDVVSLNLTMLKGGVTADNGQTYSLNVIPTECEAGFDLRIPPTIDLKEFEEQCIKVPLLLDLVSFQHVS